MSAWCLDAMVAEHDIHESRQRNQKNHNDGKSLEEKMGSGKKVTDGKLFAAGECCLG